MGGWFYSGGGGAAESAHLKQHVKGLEQAGLDEEDRGVCVLRSAGSSRREMDEDEAIAGGSVRRQWSERVVV